MPKKILALSLDYDDCLISTHDSKGQIRNGEDGFDIISQDEFRSHVDYCQPLLNKHKWKQCLIDDNKPNGTNLRNSHFKRSLFYSRISLVFAAEGKILADA